MKFRFFFQKLFKPNEFKFQRELNESETLNKKQLDNQSSNMHIFTVKTLSFGFRCKMHVLMQYENSKQKIKVNSILFRNDNFTNP